MWLFAILRPIAMLWLGLKVLDEFSIVMRLVRLGFAILPIPRKHNTDEALCDVCDDVMGDILVQGGVDVLPCNIMCLGFTSCVQMCEHIKDISATSTKYPCAAAGYCDATKENFVEKSDIDCRVGRFFTCEPRKYCHRFRKGFKWSCKLRPGIGRWVGLQHSFTAHVGAMGVALLTQPHCSDPNAGPYCIAKPKGFISIICDILVYILSIVYGGYRSIVAIESPGGDDDIQWLTFWIILSLVLSIERCFLRPILSIFSLYYEFKLLAVVWLVYFQGAEKVYRKFRKFLLAKKLLFGSVCNANDIAIKELLSLEEIGGAFIREKIKTIKEEIDTHRLETTIQNEEDITSSIRSHHPGGDFAVNWEPVTNVSSNVNEIDSAEVLYKLSLFLLSSVGIEELIKSNNNIPSKERDILLTQASFHLRFQPKYLYIFNIGVVDGNKGELPPMDPNGLADPYITCWLVDSSRVRQRKKSGKAITRILYRTKRPKWNDLLELTLNMGSIDDFTGIYNNDSINFENLSVQLEMWDKDVGFWGVILRFDRIGLGCLIIATIVGYVTGFADTFTSERLIIFRIVYVIFALLWLLSFVMSVIRRADDIPIGQCTVPLKILMDKRKHHLRFKLHSITSKQRPSFKNLMKEEKYVTPTNSVGGYGVIQATFMLTEK